MRTALYARVSTLNNGQDVSMQVREFEEFCASRKWTIADRYIDSGISGSRDSRPELNRHLGSVNSNVTTSPQLKSAGYAAFLVY